jgi:hypothetical protein
MSPDKKKIEKIYSQIDKLATKGKEYIYEYYKLVDDLISKGEYNYYEMTLFYKYNISIIDNNNIKETRAKTWNEILFQTNSSVSKKIKKILDSKSVYQMGFDIYSDTVSNISLSIGSPLSSTYSVTSSTQSVSISRLNNSVYLTTNDDNIYKIDIYYARWENNKPIETTVDFLQSISIRDSYNWSFLGSTSSSLPFVTFYSSTRPNLLLVNDDVKISTDVPEYNGVFKVKRITDTNYWNVTINENFTSNSSSGTFSLYPTITDSIRTEIPTTQGGSYIIRTYMRNSNTLSNYELNYKVNIEKSQLLGTIVEVDQFSVDSKYYLENKQFAKLMGTRVTYLEATYVGATASVIVNATNTSLSEDNNLVNRYKLAVEYLLSNS